LTTQRHRVAIIGTGTSVGNHLEAYEAVKDRIEVVAAVDINEARLMEVAHANNIPRMYTDVGQMLATEKPDLVSIVTPPWTHKTLIIECLEAGAWVFCEKPLVASLAEFDAITEAEQRTGRYVSTVFQWRFGSAGKHLRNLIQTEAFGRPLVAVCNTLWYRTQDYYNVSWRGKWKTEVGGPTMGLGIHLMDMFLSLMGDWDEVRAMAGTLDRQIEVEDVSMAMVRFANGSMASIINSALSPREETYLRLDFQKATLELTTLYRYSNQHWRITLPGKVDAPEVLAHWNDLKDDLSGSHGVQLADVLDSFERNERPYVSGMEARRILEFASSLYKSAFTGKPVLRGEIDANDPYYYAMNGAPETINP
jgi:predicted dehydrogenase